MELSSGLETAERLIWGAFGLVSFIILIAYLRWMGPLEDQSKTKIKVRRRLARRGSAKQETALDKLCAVGAATKWRAMPLWVTCGRRLGKNFLTQLQHWSGAVMCPAC